MNMVRSFNKEKWAIYLMAFLIGGAIGIIIPLTSTHMSKNHVSNFAIGVIASVYFFAIALGTILINKKMKNIDLKKFISVGLIISSTCTIMFPFAKTPYVWFAIMCLIGFGISFHLVGTQTALHILSEEEIRGVTSGIYTLSFAIGYATGTISGPLIYEKNILVSFITGAAFLIIASLIVLFKIKIKITVVTYKKRRITQSISLALQAAFSYGFIENTIAALYPVFLLRYNFTVAQMGLALGMFVIGGIVGTIPITYIGDKIGREKGLIIGVLISIIALLGITNFDVFKYKLIFSFIAGTGIGSIYPISMALGTQNLKKDDIAVEASRFTFFYSFGSAAGPVLSSIIINKFSTKYLFSLSITFLIALFVNIVYKSKNKKLVQGVE